MFKSIISSKDECWFKRIWHLNDDVCGLLKLISVTGIAVATESKSQRPDQITHRFSHCYLEMIFKFGLLKLTARLSRYLCPRLGKTDTWCSTEHLTGRQQGFAEATGELSAAAGSLFSHVSEDSIRRTTSGAEHVYLQVQEVGALLLKYERGASYQTEEPFSGGTWDDLSRKVTTVFLI